MERVKKGEKYWYIDLEGDWCTYWDIEDYLSSDDLIAIGNYYHTEEQAESVVRKLRAVLKGADVIEMPSEEEINKQGIEFISDLHGRLYNATSEEMCLQLITYNACGNWLKSKIVK